MAATLFPDSERARRAYFFSFSRGRGVERYRIRGESMSLCVGRAKVRSCTTAPSVRGLVDTPVAKEDLGSFHVISSRLLFFRFCRKRSDSVTYRLSC